MGGIQNNVDRRSDVYVLFSYRVDRSDTGSDNDMETEVKGGPYLCVD